MMTAMNTFCEKEESEREAKTAREILSQLKVMNEHMPVSSVRLTLFNVTFTLSLAKEHSSEGRRLDGWRNIKLCRLNKSSWRAATP